MGDRGSSPAHQPAPFEKSQGPASLQALDFGTGGEGSTNRRGAHRIDLVKHARAVFAAPAAGPKVTCAGAGIAANTEVKPMISKSLRIRLAFSSEAVLEIEWNSAEVSPVAPAHL
jgi:hypothetical protein